MFQLHPQLAADSFAVTEWPLCAVRLVNDSRFPWLILVPRQDGLRELHDLSGDELPVLMAEMARASDALARGFAPDKVNTGALGNVVAQLHVHVIARWRSDPAWPGPVWGAGQPRPYPETEQKAVLAQMSEVLAQGSAQGM